MIFPKLSRYSPLSIFGAVISKKGWRPNPLRAVLAVKMVEAVIPSRHTRKQPQDFDRLRYQERTIVERCINKLM